jgi:hypothetical protein
LKTKEVLEKISDAMLMADYENAIQIIKSLLEGKTNQ